jgi:FkbM family methyltransferase
MVNKMKILDLRKSFFEKKITKKNYINKIYNNWHDKLFQYKDFIGETNLKSINITDKELIFETKNNIKLYCTPGDKRIAPIEFLNFGEYEKKELDIIGKLVKKDFTFVDVGANIGWHSINVAKKNKNIKLYAFEPVPSTFQWLNHNIRLNKIKNITAHNMGLYNSNKTSNIFFYPTSSAASSLKNTQKEKKIFKIKCKMTTMDNIFYKNNKKVDFIKCDVEGSEYLFLKGASRTLKKYRPTMLIEILRKWSKFFVNNPNKIFEYLDKIGYVSFSINENSIKRFKSMNKQTKATNFLFVHKTKITSFLRDLKKFNII